MMGKNTVAKLSSFLLMSPMFLGLFGLAWLDPDMGLAMLVDPDMVELRRGSGGLLTPSFLKKKQAWLIPFIRTLHTD
jgi:hypothetical protein